MMKAPGSPGSFFGRRKGKTLRPGQERLIADLLPRLRVELPTDGAPLDLSGLFPARISRYRLEIGFGGGEHLADVARRNPGIGFIGCEPFVNGVAKLLAVIEAEGLDNIRIFDGDATELLPVLPAASLERADILFPDPWPKRRQRKRRIVSDESLAALARVVPPGGELRFASDIDDYLGWVLVRILRSSDWIWPAESAAAWRSPWPDWPGTRYEAKARREGRLSSYLGFTRT